MDGMTGTTPRTQIHDRAAINPCDIPNQPQIHRIPRLIPQDQPFTEKDICRPEIEGLCPSAQIFDPFGQFLIDFVGEDLFHNLDRCFVCVAPSLDKSRLDTGLFHCPADGSPPAMDDHRLHPDRFHKEDIEQEMTYRPLVLHHAATQFDHRDFATESTDPAQGLDQNISFFDGFLQRLGPRSLIELQPESETNSG